jgi:hypothetical protein
MKTTAATEKKIGLTVCWWIRVTLCLLVFGSLFGCKSSTELTESWSNPTLRAVPLSNLLILVLKEEPLKRRVWEDAVVTALRKQGVKSVASYRYVPDEKPDTSEVRKLLHDNSHDGVLVINKTGRDFKLRSVPQSVIRVPVDVVPSPFYGTLTTIYRDEVASGFLTEDKIVYYEAHLWAHENGGELLWTCKTETQNPNSLAEISSGVANEVVAKLRRDKQIGKR